MVATNIGNFDVSEITCDNCVFWDPIEVDNSPMKGQCARDPRGSLIPPIKNPDEYCGKFEKRT